MNMKAYALEQWIEQGDGRIVCPACGGGGGNEKSMTIYETNDGSVLATCHRASCRVDTFLVLASANTGRPPVRAAPPAKLMPSEYLMADRINDEEVEYIRDKYTYEYGRHVLDLYVKKVKNGLVFPMYDALGAKQGAIVRPYEGPRKALTYKISPEYSGMSWYRDKRDLSISTVYIVEDVYSALAMYQQRRCSISLNGTNFNRDRLEEILTMQWRVVLMLDADATRKAIKYRLEYGPDVVGVARLVKDPKDMPKAELEDTLVAAGL